MSITREAAEHLAAVIAAIQPGWHVPGIVAALAEVRDRPLDAVTIAAVAAARDPQNRTPAIIAKAGPHWRDAYAGTAPAPSERRRCDQCGGWHAAHEDHDYRTSLARPSDVPEYVAAREALSARVASGTVDPDPTYPTDPTAAQNGTQSSEADQ